MADDLLPPPVSEWPTARPGGQKIACPTCGATGWPPDGCDNPQHWTTRHLGVEHVRCECGVVRLPKGLATHQRSPAHLRAMES